MEADDNKGAATPPHSNTRRGVLTRRKFLAGGSVLTTAAIVSPSGFGTFAGPPALLASMTSPYPARENDMTIVCIIRYEIDPFQREAFREYAANWGHVIPRCGGRLIGYFLPWQGTDYVGWGLIAFDSLAAYETYQARLREDPDGRKNFGFAQAKQFIRKEERNFVEVVNGTFNYAAKA